MTGESDASSAGPTAVWREHSLPQPGAREPAPGELALVQSFINSHYDLEFEHGADLLATPAALERWLSRRALLGSEPGAPALTEGGVSRAIAVREGLRALARTNGGHGPTPTKFAAASALAELNQAARGATIEVRFGDGGPRFICGPGAALDRALALLLAIAARAMIDGSWGRLKICPGDDCGWAFFDHSRNQSGRWCSMAVCGGRAKARAHYRRRRGEGD